MISYPREWKKIGAAITTNEIEDAVIGVLEELGCNCLSFSGGIDSTLLLYYMCQIWHKVKVFTVGRSENHPDVAHARAVVKAFQNKQTDIEHHVLCLTEKTETLRGEKHLGDNAVKLFYEFVALHTDRIIAGDVVDEYTCGYYAHQTLPTEEVYYEHIRRLQKDHLIPLDKNSGKVKVCLPYADDEVVALLSQIPIKDKVDSETRKKVIIEMARGKVPDEVILRRKYGFCDALVIKK